MRVHALQTGRNVGNETLMRTASWSALLRQRKWMEFPVFAYAVEHPDGLTLIDAGASRRVQVSRFQHKVLSAPATVVGPGEEIASRMRAVGLEPEMVRRIVLTHLDIDHTGGLEHFPDAEILIHRQEHDYASNPMGRLRYQPGTWPAWFAPTLYDLDPEPYGPFPASKALTESGEMRLVPLPGHTVGQVGVVAETDGHALFFAADHVLRQDWFVDDYAAGNLLGLAYFAKLAPETSRRIRRFVEETPTVFLPSHDTEAPARLAATETLQF